VKAIEATLALVARLLLAGVAVLLLAVLIVAALMPDR